MWREKLLADSNSFVSKLVDFCRKIVCFRAKAHGFLSKVGEVSRKREKAKKKGQHSPEKRREWLEM